MTQASSQPALDNDIPTGPVPNGGQSRLIEFIGRNGFTPDETDAIVGAGGEIRDSVSPLESEGIPDSGSLGIIVVLLAVLAVFVVTLRSQSSH